MARRKRPDPEPAPPAELLPRLRDAVAVVDEALGELAALPRPRRKRARNASRPKR